MSRERILVWALLLGAGAGGIAFAFACGNDAAVRSEENGEQDGGGAAPADGEATTGDAHHDDVDASKPLGIPRLYVCGDGKIRIFAFDSANYALTSVDTVTGLGDPSFLAMDPSTHFLYAVDETKNQLVAFTVADDGKLTNLQTVSSGGAGPTFVALDRAATHVMVANYTGASVSIFPRGADGRLGTAQTRGFGTGAQTHQIVTDPSDGFAFVPNKGLDLVAVLRRNDLADSGYFPAGDGARHIDFHPNGKFAFVVDELGDTVTAFSLTPATGNLTQVDQQSTLDSGVSSPSNTGAEIQVLNDGKHLIASNRGDDSLMVFDIADNGKIARKMRVPSGGNSPRHFQVEKSGRFLFVANESGKVLVMKVDPATGVPAPVGTPLSVTGSKFAALFYIDR